MDPAILDFCIAFVAAILVVHLIQVTRIVVLLAKILVRLNFLSMRLKRDDYQTELLKVNPFSAPTQEQGTV
jgi:hypothetical protein